MEWQWLENRHIIRCVFGWAAHAWEQGKIEEPLDVFRHLLLGDPHDSLGVRFHILGIRMNISPDEFIEMFENPDTARIQYWFDKNAPAYPHEFSGWFEPWKRRRATYIDGVLLKDRLAPIRQVEAPATLTTVIV